MIARTSNSRNHFIDTNVLLSHANTDSHEFSADIASILHDATGSSPSRTLWISHVLFGELRPSSFVSQQRFKDVEDLARYIRSIATVVNPDFNTMLRAARLRDVSWARPNRAPAEKPRCMTLGDAMHIASALWVKEASKVPDLEFLTFDNSADANVETDPGTKALPLLSIENYCDGISGLEDVAAVLRLPRIRPVLRQGTLGV